MGARGRGALAGLAGLCSRRWPSLAASWGRGHCPCQQRRPPVCSGGFGGGDAAALPGERGKSVCQCFFFLIFSLSVCVMVNAAGRRGAEGWGRRGTRFGTGSEGAALLPQPLCRDAAGAAACCAQPGPAPLAPLGPGGIRSSLVSAWCGYEAKEAKVGCSLAIEPRWAKALRSQTPWCFWGRGGMKQRDEIWGWHQSMTLGLVLMLL